MEKKQAPGNGQKKAPGGDAPSFQKAAKGGIIEELKLMAAGKYDHWKVAATINTLPMKERKGAVIAFLEGSLGHNTVDGIDLNEIIRDVKLPEADRMHLIENYQKYLHH